MNQIDQRPSQRNSAMSSARWQRGAVLGSLSALIAAGVGGALATPATAAAPESVTSATTAVASTAVAPTAVEPSAAPFGINNCKFSGTQDQFYLPPNPVPALRAGTILRCQPIAAGAIKGLANGRAYRVMYSTQTRAPEPHPNQFLNQVSTGMIFVPDARSPLTGRKVVAWDHGTLGLGPGCAPSKVKWPLNTFETAVPGKQYWTSLTGTPGAIGTGFINNMLAKGWVVTASDYTGIGLTGNKTGLRGYLFTASEAYDTLNAVRAARNFKGAHAAADFAVYGQSQGGHAALSVSTQVKKYAPELRLKGIAASDPAIDLQPLLATIYDQALGWALGSAAVLSWTQHNPGIDPANILTPKALSQYAAFAEKCIITQALSSNFKGGPFFTPSVLTDPTTQVMVAQQSIPVVKGIPVLISETTIDGIIPPSSVAAVQKSWCAAGADLRMNWVNVNRPTSKTNGTIAHLTSAMTDAITSITWIEDRFRSTKAANKLTTPCSVAPPVAG